MVDKEIQDQKEYIHSLIYEDKALAQQIETYLKKREILDAETRKKMLERAGIKEDKTLNDQDYIDRFNELSQEIEFDLEVQAGIEGPNEEEEKEYGISRLNAALRKV